MKFFIFIFVMSAQVAPPVVLPARDRRNTLKSDFDKVKAQTMG